MSNLQLKQPIQFLLEQLKNEENRERFDQVSYTPISPDITDSFGDLLFLSSVIDDYIDFDELTKLEQISIIRTCLSRTKETEDEDGDAIISIFEGDSASSSGRGIDRYDKISDLLGEEFDLLIRHSYSLDEAIDSLGERMVDLVPEYEEFCKTDLK